MFNLINRSGKAPGHSAGIGVSSTGRISGELELAVAAVVESADVAGVEPAPFSSCNESGADVVAV